MCTILSHGAGRGEVRPGAVVPVAVAPMRLMGFFLLREEPVTDRTLTEIAGQVMLPPDRQRPRSSYGARTASGLHEVRVPADMALPHRAGRWRRTRMAFCAARTWCVAVRQETLDGVIDSRLAWPGQRLSRCDLTIRPGPDVPQPCVV